MFYNGKIDKINKLVVSDPSYGAAVSCRYECNNAASGKPWNVQLAIANTESAYEGFTCRGVEFGMLLTSGSLPSGHGILSADGASFSCPERLSIKEYEIGMDTACVALGINACADEINASCGAWQPPCALKTLTDGLFGSVFEGTYSGATHLVYISGYLDEDTGYSVDDIVKYLSSTFEFKDLQIVKEKASLDDRIGEANQSKRSSEEPEKNTEPHERF